MAFSLPPWPLACPRGGHVEGYCPSRQFPADYFIDVTLRGNDMTIWIWILTAALNGLLAVAGGAVAAHLFAGDLHRLALMSTAAQYALYHAAALLALAALAERVTEGGGFLAAAAWLFIAGTVLFSGSLYLLALTASRAFAWVTPFGGIALMLGWAALALHAGQLFYRRRS
jgi:uncharacterized membrane protein YgdD (TMEM256/DUF423 family)